LSRFPAPLFFVSVPSSKTEAIGGSAYYNGATILSFFFLAAFFCRKTSSRHMAVIMHDKSWHRCDPFHRLWLFSLSRFFGDRDTTCCWMILIIAEKNIKLKMTPMKLGH
jgi:hypothetical protein